MSNLKSSNIFPESTAYGLDVKPLASVYYKEELEDTCIEALPVAQCPLCGGNLYTENDNVSANKMSESYCKCPSNENKKLL